MRRLALLALAACGAPPTSPVTPAPHPADWHALARVALDDAAHGNIAHARVIAAQAIAGAARDGVVLHPRVMENLRDGIDHVVADPTGARIATILPPRRSPKDFAYAIVWSTARGRDLYRLPHTPALAFDRDGHVVTGHLDGTVVLRDAATGRALRDLGKLTDPIQWVGIASDGKILAADGFKIRMWNDAGTSLHEWAGPPYKTWGHMAHYELSADGDTLVAVTETDKGNAYVTYSLADPTQPPVTSLLAAVGMPTGALAVSPNGTRAAFGITSDPPSVEIVDLAHHHTLVRLRDTPNAALAFRDEDTLVALGTRLEQWSLHDGKRLASDPLPVTATATDFARDGSLVIAATGEDVALLPVDEVHVASRFGHSDGPGAIAWSPDGTQLAFGDARGHVAVWHLSGDDTPQFRDVTGRVTALVLDDAGNLAAATDTDREERVIAWSPDGTRVLDTDSGPLVTLTFDHGGVAGATQYSEIYAWDANHQPLDPAPQLTLDLPWRARFGELRAERDNQRVIVRRQRDDRALAILRHDSDVLALAGHGSLLAVALDDGSIVLSDPATGASLGRLVGPRDFADVQLAIRPDGRTLAAVRSDGMIELWDLPSRTRVAELSLAAGGHWIAIGGDGHVDGEPAATAPFTWELGDVTLPATLGWQAGRVPAVVEHALAKPAAPVAIAPVSPAPRTAARCMPQAEHDVARIELVGSTLHLCYIHAPDDAWCFDLDLPGGAVRPVVADLEIQAAKMIEQEITRQASTLWVPSVPAVTPPPPAPAAPPPLRYTAGFVDADNQPGLVEIRDHATGKRVRRIQLDEEERASSVEIWDGELLVTVFPCAGPCAYGTLYSVETGRRLAAVGGDDERADTYDFAPTLMHDHVFAFPSGAGGGMIVFQDTHTGHVVARVGTKELGISEHGWLATEELRTPAGTLLLVGNHDLSGQVWELGGNGKVLHHWQLPLCPKDETAGD